jgi:hypothetical protein
MWSCEIGGPEGDGAVLVTHMKDSIVRVLSKGGG